MPVTRAAETHPVVALNQRRLFWCGGETLYHGHHRVRHLGDVAALILPAGELRRQHLFGLETPETEIRGGGGVGGTGVRRCITEGSRCAGRSSLSRLTLSWKLLI